MTLIFVVDLDINKMYLRRKDKAVDRGIQKLDAEQDRQTNRRDWMCSLEHAKKSFYRAANAVFAKIGRVASEEVTLQLIKVKCLPVLYYICLLYTSDAADE